MSPQDIAQLIVIVRDITLAGLMFVALVGGKLGWYVWRWTYERDIASKDATIARILQDHEYERRNGAKWEARTMRLLNVTEGLSEKVSA